MSSTYKELNEGTIMTCNTPPIEDMLTTTKENPLEWDGFESMKEPSKIQNNDSFQEHKFAIKICIDAIKYYSNVCQSSMVKSCTIRRCASCVKTWRMQCILLN